MHSKSDNIEITIKDEVIKKLFDSLKIRYQNDLQSIRGSEFVFDYVRSLDYKCHEINLSCGGSYINSPDSIKNKKATIYSINKKGNKCFRYALTVALNYDKIGKNAERITKIKPFINKYNCEGINYPSEKDDWKKIDQNNLTIGNCS